MNSYSFCTSVFVCKDDATNYIHYNTGLAPCLNFTHSIDSIWSYMLPVHRIWCTPVYRDICKIIKIYKTKIEIEADNVVNVNFYCFCLCYTMNWIACCKMCTILHAIIYTNVILLVVLFDEVGLAGTNEVMIELVTVDKAAEYVQKVHI